MNSFTYIHSFAFFKEFAKNLSDFVYGFNEKCFRKPKLLLKICLYKTSINIPMMKFFNDLVMYFVASCCCC